MKRSINTDSILPKLFKATMVATMLSLLVASSFAQDVVIIEPIEDARPPVTVGDPAIPTDQLDLALKPLTVSELHREMGAWMFLLKMKVQEISDREIEVRKKNAEIAAQEEAAAAVAEAQDALAEGKAVDSEALKEAAEEVVEAESASEEAAPDAIAAIADSTVSDTNELAVVANEVEENLEKDEAVKVVALDELNVLRTERTALIERLRIVLDELEAKGGATDEARYYIAAVSEISLDVSDKQAAWAALIGWLSSEEGGLRIGGNLLKFVLILVAAWFISRFIGSLLKRALGANRNLTELMRAFLIVAVRRLILGVGLIFGLSALEVDIGPLLAMIGAAGFVVAFALQGTLSNFASGLMILYYKPFDVGDWVEVSGMSGSVSALNLVSTTISSGDNKTMIVPNNAIWGDVITNATGTTERRIDMVFGIGYDDDMAQAEAILKKIVDEHEAVLSEPEPVIRVHELADSSVNFIVRPWVRPDDYWATYWDVTRKVKEEFDAQGVSFPYPQRDVHVYNQSVSGDATDSGE